MIPPAPTATGTTAVSNIFNGSRTVETLAPTFYTHFASLTGTLTTTLVDSQSVPQTVILGPSGAAWAPLDPVPGSSIINYPSTQAAEPNGSLNKSRGILPSSNVPPEETVLAETLGSATLTETYVAVTVPPYASLNSTTYTTPLDSKSSPITILIGSGGLKWTPINKPSGVPDVPPPSIPPTDPKLSTIQISTPPTATRILSATPGTDPPTITATVTSLDTTSSAAYSSILGAFDDAAQITTTLIIGSVTEVWSKATFADLSTITAPITVTTPIVQTNGDGSQSTLPAAAIIVGPKGVW